MEPESDKSRLDCGAAMERGSIEGTYLIWTYKPSRAGGLLRAMTAGLFSIGPMLGEHAVWPRRLAAYRCPDCGHGCW